MDSYFKYFLIKLNMPNPIHFENHNKICELYDFDFNKTINLVIFALMIPLIYLQTDAALHPKFFVLFGPCGKKSGDHWSK